MPFLNTVYLERLISRLAKDLLNWNESFIRCQIKDIDGDRLTVKILKLLFLSELKTKREILKNKLGNFYLLADRFEYFHDIILSPKNVISLLDSHQERVEWQIRRIYRARNLIVHSGKTPSYTEILIENAHDYLDIVMKKLMDLASKPKEIISISQGFKHVELSYNSFRKWLEQPTLKFDHNNIGQLLNQSKNAGNSV